MRVPPAACRAATTDSTAARLVWVNITSALAFQHLVGIEEVRLCDVGPRATAKLMPNLQRAPGARGPRLTACESTAAAVRGADIVTTITADKTNATIITPDMLSPGLHINAVGGDCPGKTEIHPDVLRAATVVVEDEPQTRGEGDVQQLSSTFPVIEIRQILNGQASGRIDQTQITVFDSVGFVLEDCSALRDVHGLAQTLSIGSALPLIPELDDPTDLYAMIGAVELVQAS